MGRTPKLPFCPEWYLWYFIDGHQKQHKKWLKYKHNHKLHNQIRIDWQHPPNCSPRGPKQFHSNFLMPDWRSTLQHLLLQLHIHLIIIHQKQINNPYKCPKLSSKYKWDQDIFENIHIVPNWRKFGNYQSSDCLIIFVYWFECQFFDCWE